MDNHWTAEIIRSVSILILSMVWLLPIISHTNTNISDNKYLFAHELYTEKELQVCSLSIEN